MVKLLHDIRSNQVTAMTAQGVKLIQPKGKKPEVPSAT